MTAQTQRWMKRELQQLLAQRDRYAQAESASTDVRQKVSHTTQRLRLDEEIQGRREAIAALEQHRSDGRLRVRDRGLSRPRPVVAPGSPAAPRSGLLPLTLGVCVATFCLGFALMGNIVTESTPASSPTMVQRYRPLAPPPPVRVEKRSKDPVMAAVATPQRRRR